MAEHLIGYGRVYEGAALGMSRIRSRIYQSDEPQTCDPGGRDSHPLAPGDYYTKRNPVRSNHGRGSRYSQVPYCVVCARIPVYSIERKDGQPPSRPTGRSYWIGGGPNEIVAVCGEDTFSALDAENGYVPSGARWLQ